MKPKIWVIPFKRNQLCYKYIYFKKKKKRIPQLAKSRLAIDN